MNTRQGKALEAVVEAVAARAGIDRQNRLWHRMADKAHDEIRLWTASHRAPASDLERVLEEARLANAEAAEQKDRNRAAVAAIVEAGRAARNPPLDPDRVLITVRCEETGALARITLPAASVEVLNLRTSRPLRRPLADAA